MVRVASRHLAAEEAPASYKDVTQARRRQWGVLRSCRRQRQHFALLCVWQLSARRSAPAEQPRVLAIACQPACLPSLAPTLASLSSARRTPFLPTPSPLAAHRWWRLAMLQGSAARLPACGRWWLSRADGVDCVQPTEPRPCPACFSVPLPSSLAAAGCSCLLACVTEAGPGPPGGRLWKQCDEGVQCRNETTAEAGCPSGPIVVNQSPPTAGEQCTKHVAVATGNFTSMEQNAVPRRWFRLLLEGYWARTKSNVGARARGKKPHEGMHEMGDM